MLALANQVEAHVKAAAEDCTVMQAPGKKSVECANNAAQQNTNHITHAQVPVTAYHAQEIITRANLEASVAAFVVSENIEIRSIMDAWSVRLVALRMGLVEDMGINT